MNLLGVKMYLTCSKRRKDKGTKRISFTLILHDAQ